MAGDWLKFDKSTPDKPEVWQIADALDIDPDAVVGKLMRLWSWMDDHTQDGNAPSVSKKLLDRVVGVTGFCDAVIEAGWLVDDGQHLSAVNFDRHNGKTAKNRALTAKRVAQHKQKTNTTGNDSLTPDALPREEKRREEKNKDSGQAKPAPKAKVTKADLVNEYGLPDDLVVQFLAIRKDKRQTLTPLAMTQLMAEFEKAGLTLHDGIALCCEKSWGAFKASWGKQGAPANNNEQRKIVDL